MTFLNCVSTHTQAYVSQTHPYNNHESKKKIEREKKNVNVCDVGAMGWVLCILFLKSREREESSERMWGERVWGMKSINECFLHLNHPPSVTADAAFPLLILLLHFSFPRWTLIKNYSTYESRGFCMGFSSTTWIHCIEKGWLDSPLENFSIPYSTLYLIRIVKKNIFFWSWEWFFHGWCWWWWWRYGWKILNENFMLLSEFHVEVDRKILFQ